MVQRKLILSKHTRQSFDTQTKMHQALTEWTDHTFHLNKPRHEAKISKILPSEQKYNTSQPISTSYFNKRNYIDATRLFADLYTRICNETKKGVQINGMLLR